MNDGISDQTTQRIESVIGTFDAKMINFILG